MATLAVTGPKFSIDGVNAYVLGGEKSGPATLTVIDLRVGTAVGLSVTVKGRRAGSANPPVPIPYRKHYLNGAVGDETFVSVAITTDSLIEVNSAGLDIVLDATALTSGAASVDFAPITG